MDSSSSSSSSSSQALSTSASSPRSRELQGPRPAPLRVRKDSHKVRKPPVAPSSHFPQPNTNTTTTFQQHRTTPLIIYTVSPKVIHTNPDDFMTLVQRLTGADGHQHQRSSTSSAELMFDNTQGSTSSTNRAGAGLMSPAARYAVMDKINSHQQQSMISGGRAQDDIIIGSSAETPFHIEPSMISSRQFVPSGILSPGPAASLAPNSTFFSPLSSDPNAMSNFFQGLSPMMNQNHQQVIGNFSGSSNNNNYQQQLIPSPGSSNLFLSPSIISSPTIYSLDLFNNFGDW